MATIDVALVSAFLENLNRSGGILQKERVVIDFTSEQECFTEQQITEIEKLEDAITYLRWALKAFEHCEAEIDDLSRSFSKQKRKRKAAIAGIQM